MFSDAGCRLSQGRASEAPPPEPAGLVELDRAIRAGSPLSTQGKRITCSRDDVAAFCRLHLLTRRRLGVPAGAGLFVLGRQSTALKYSASDPALWHLKPNRLVLWTAIERACELGCSVFDFGRSELEHTTLRRFKSSWGAVETPLVYSSCGAVGGAARGVLGASRAREALSQVIRRSPIFVCQAIGELLYPLAG